VYARTDAGGGGEESQDNPTGCGECFFCLGGKSRGAFGQPAFFLAGNRMTIVAFEKKAALKSLAKRLFDSTEVLNRGKHVMSVNGKKSFKRILVEGEKFKLRKLL